MPPSYSSLAPVSPVNGVATTAHSSSPSETNASVAYSLPSPNTPSVSTPQSEPSAAVSPYQSSPLAQHAFQSSSPMPQQQQPYPVPPQSTQSYSAPPPPTASQQQPYPVPQQQPAIQQVPYPVSQPYTQQYQQQQQYSPPAPNPASHYGHRPYVMPGSESQSYPIIMAIDWGTTYSSMAYAYQQDGEVHEISTWPKQSHNYPKVPTCNLYGPGSKEILEWGYPAKIAMTKPPYKNHVLLSKYKLHLDESSGPHPPLPNGLSVVDAIADYLRLFHAHVVQTALQGFGSAFEQHHIQYCLSVPAMWTDHAKAVMRQAALQAGMITPMDPPHRLLLISEPEAAALYCEKKCDQFSIGHGQRFMICDAGGGTVDLIVFEVASGPRGRTLREVTRGSGHSCGSIFLDERMEVLLRRKFSKWQDKGLTPANWTQLMETFIHQVKPLFDGIDDQYITMPAVPGRGDLTDYDIGLEDGVLTITAEEMRREVFDPVIDDVLRLIQHQLQQTNFNCHAIFMVGGFGCSGYLNTRVRAEFGNRVGLIAMPPRAELAVVRGAALAGISPRVVAARVARRFYGVDSLMSFEFGVDMPHKQVRDNEGHMRARDRFSVYVVPGQQIGIDECITKRYVTYQYPNPINSPLYACSAMTLPRYVDSPLVEKIGDFLIPLPFIPGAVAGQKVIFELRMYFGATEIRAEAEVNGVVVSTRCHFAG
ncbi:Heat shock 70 kDa protein 12A [Mortierella sp. 14UC]|nr:Heat shock 70 kDa protein 12A [Mortierella sp. 14UC]